MHQIEVFVLIDAEGDYVADSSRETLQDRYEELIGGSLIGSRVVALTLDVAMPEPIAATVAVPIATGSLTVAVA